MNPLKKYILLILLLTAFVPFFELFTSTNQALLFRDISRHYLPQKKFWREEVLQKKSIPLWNPYIAGGFPSLAESSMGALYPANAMLLLGSEEKFPWTFSVFLAFHFLFFAVGCFLFFCTLGLAPNAAALWSLSLTWSGPFLSLHCVPHTLVAYAFLPWCLYSVVKIRTSFSVWHYTFLFSLFLSLSFLNGDPLQVFFFMPILLIPIYFIPGKKAQLKSKGLFFYLAAIGLFLLLVLPQLLATLEYLPYSIRNVIPRAEGAPALWSLHPYRFLEILWPQAWGSIRYWYSPEIEKISGAPVAQGFFLSDLHFGYFPVFILIRFLFRRKFSSEQKSIFGCAFLTLWFSMGSFAWPYFVDRIPDSFPILSGYRFTERLFPLALFLLFWLACTKKEIFEENPWFLRLGWILLVLQGAGFARNTLVFSPITAVLPNSAVRKILEHEEKIKTPPRIAERFFGADSEIIRASLGEEYSKKMALGWDSLAINHPAYFKIRESAGYMSIYPKNYYWLINTVKAKDPKRWVDLTSTKYLLSRESVEGKVWLNEKELPVFSFSANPRRVANQEQMAHDLLAADFSPVNTVLLENGNFAPSTTVVESFEVKTSEAERIELKVTTKNSGLLYLLFNETYYPKWKALVNGKTTIIAEANGWAMLIPLKVTAGENKVELYFSRISFHLSLLGPALWLALFLVVSFLKPRRAPAPNQTLSRKKRSPSP